MFLLLKLVLMFVSVCAAREISDEELHRLPKLFHLDDYDRCLSQEDGVYCVGIFELSPKTTPNPAYELITERLKQHFSFDRRLLHRGYCLNKRCPSEEQNTTLSFEQCINRHLRKYALTARLKKLSYCTTHVERKAKLSAPPDLPQRLFLYAVYFILFLNVLGTVHDVYGDDKKNKHLLAWSIPANWKSLTTVKDETSLFAPVQSSKIILYCIIIYAHVNLIHFMGFMHNPELSEKIRDKFVNILIRNGTSLVQVFILISSFFTGYNTLQTARRSTISAGLAIKWILKRIFRLAPVYLLLSAYSATWWPRVGDGPLWSPLVEAESQVCRNKFWTHVLFVNNFVQPWQQCMVQSWAMAADVQLFLVSLLLTLLLMKLKVRVVPILAAMFAASCLFNIMLAYVAELVPMVQVIVPDVLRTQFRGSRSFFHLHTSPWSNLPACLFGLLVAHVYFEQKNKRKAKTEDERETTNINRSICSGIKKENGVLLNGKSILVNGNCSLVNDCSAIFYRNNALSNGNGALINGNGKLIRGNGTSLNENGAVCYGNGTIINGNSAVCDSNGTICNENGTLLNRNGTVRDGNTTLLNGNGAVCYGNGTLINGNGAVCNGNGAFFNGNGTLLNQNGTVCDGNSTLPNGNGAVCNRNFTLLNGNSAVCNGNGALGDIDNVLADKIDATTNKNDNNILKNNCVLANENGLHVIENGKVVKERSATKDNCACVKKNENKNAAYTNDLDLKIKNEIRHRAHVSNDIMKNCNAKNVVHFYEKNSNGIETHTNNLSGLSKCDGYENQNGQLLQNKDKNDIKRAPFLLRYAHCFTFPILIVWVLVGSRVAGVSSSPVMALYVGLERLMFSLTFAAQLLQVITIKGPWARLFSWRGWTVPARLVFCVAMVHWCVNMTIHATRPQPVYFSLLYVSIDWLATLFYSYMAALPICILVELPCKKAIDAIVS